MKNRRVDYRWLLRWFVVITLLLFIIWVSNEVIQLSCQRQERLEMQDRSKWIQQLILGRDIRRSIKNSDTMRKLSLFAREENIQVALYQKNGRFVTGSRIRGLTFDPSASYQQKGKESLYISKTNDDKGTYGYLVIKGRKTEIPGLGFFYLLFFLVGLSLLFLRERLELSYSKPVDFAVQITHSALNGNYQLIAPDNVKHESVLHMNLGLNRLSEKLHELDREIGRQRSSMTTLIENIGNGLILIDGNHRISYINEQFKENFHTDAVHWLMADYEFVIPYPEIKAMIDQVFQKKVRVTRQLQLTLDIERRYFDVSCAPILDHRQKVRGIVVVFHDITDIKKLESMRKDFVANVSHELRTPITSIIGFTETLLDGAKDDRQSEEQFLNIILNEGQRLKSLTADLLDLSKIEREKFKLDWQTVSLSEILDTVLPIFKDKAEKKKIAIDRLPGTDGIVAGDPFRIRQVMINLINNALAYTTENGKIAVSIRETPQTASFIISDTGIGIAPDQIPRIFERFYRVDKARSRDSGGTGLGLAIVKHLVEAHGGKIKVQSAVGKGTTFTITFKKKARVNG